VVGIFRWTSGNLPHEAYKIDTPVATIGIRGTTIEMIIADSGSARSRWPAVPSW